MIGRGAYGRPWLAGVIANELEAGSGQATPSLSQERDILLQQMEATLALYGEALGNKTFRKHLGWTLGRLQQRGYITMESFTELRRTLLCETENSKVRPAIFNLFARAGDLREAA